MSINKPYRSAEELPDLIPVFPLAGVLLLPRGQLPLNIFEPRYMAMIDDALKSHRLIGMIQPQQNEDERARHPRLEKVGCLGRITQIAETRTDAATRAAGKATERLFLPLLPRVPTGPPPQLVQRAIARDGHQPRDEPAALRIERGGLPPDAEIHLLHNILGELGVAQNPDADGVDQRAVAVIQPLQRGNLSIGNRGDQVSVRGQGIPTAVAASPRSLPVLRARSTTACER